MNDEDAKPRQESVDRLPLLNLNTATPEEVVAEAKRKGLLDKTFTSQFGPAIDAARTTSRALELSGQGEGIESEVRSMWKAIDVGFRRKEKALHPDRDITEKIADTSRPDQEALNAILTGEGVFFGRNGEATDLIGYLTSYYAPLIAMGMTLDLNLVQAEVIRDSTFRTHLSKQSDKAREIQQNLDRCIQYGIPIAVLNIGFNGETYTVPLICLPQYLKSRRVFGTYLPNMIGGRPKDAYISLNPGDALETDGSGGTGIMSFSAVLVHEIDHAIYYSIRESKERQTQDALTHLESQRGVMGEEEYSNRRYDLTTDRLTHIIGDILYSIPQTIGSEGLATMAQSTFLEVQAQGLKRFLPEAPKFEEACKLVTLNMRFLDQRQIGRLLYSIGGLLMPVAVESSPVEHRVYTSDFMDNLVRNRPDIIKGLIRELFANLNSTSQELAPLMDAPYAQLSRDHIRQEFEAFLKGRGLAFLLGQGYLNFIADIPDFVAKFDDDQVQSLIDHLCSTSGVPINAWLAQGTSIRDTLEVLLASTGPIHDRYEAEVEALLPPQ